MKYFKLLAILVFSQSFAFAENLEHSLIGTWKSEKEKTIEDMQKHPEIPEKSRQFLEGDFFGRLINIIKSDKSAAYFIDDSEKKLIYYPYKIIRTGSDFIVIRQFNPLLMRTEEQKWFFEGDCIYTYITKWNFREYFCRVL